MTDNELLIAFSNIVHSQLEELTTEQRNLAAELHSLTIEHSNLAAEHRDTRSLLENLATEQRNLATEQRNLATEQRNLAAEHRDTRSLLETLIKEHREEAQKNLETRILIENEVIPRLQNIESCYTSTYQRYVDGIQQIDTLQTDVDVLKIVVAEHSEQLQKIS